MNPSVKPTWILGIALGVISSLAYLPLGHYFDLIACTNVEVDFIEFLPPLAYALGIYFILVSPITRLAAPSLEEMENQSVRTAIIAALIFPPLFGLAYYLGRGGDLLEWHESTLTILTGAILSALTYEKSKKPWAMALVLIVCTTLPFFVVNDMLATFDLPLQYIVSSPRFYLLRSLLSVFAIFIATSIIGNGSCAKRKLQGLGVVIICYVGYMVCVRVLVPLGYALSKDEALWEYIQWDVLWLLMAFIPALLFHPKKRWFRFLCFVTVAAIGLSLVLLIRSLTAPALNYWVLSCATHNFSVLLIFSSLAALLLQKNIQTEFEQ